MKEPKIRFKGFSGEWKELPFSEIVERTSSTGKTGSLPGIEFEDIVSGEGCLNKDVYQKDCRKYGKIFREGDILFGKLRPYLKNILLAEFRGIAIGDFWILRPGDNDSKFIYNLVNSEAFMRVANVSSGSKMPRADWNLVSSTNFLLPQDKIEQEAIGKYFTSLDTQISASTSRLASLKQVKAASLQAMFPQEGETVPKVRFKGFEGEWKKVKFDKAFSFLKNNSLSRAELCNDGDIINIHYGDVLIKYGDILDIGNDEVIYVADSNVASKLYTDCPIVNGDIIIADAAEDFTVGKCVEVQNVTKQKIVSGLHTIPCRPLESTAPNFWGYYINSNSFHRQLLPMIQGSKISSISKTSLSATYVVFPVVEEQQSIASFFTSLDRQIALHTQRLEKLKQIKAACLDKMFV